MIDYVVVFDQFLRVEDELAKLKRIIRRQIFGDIDFKPNCFGKFDKNSATCLDCVEQDGCEIKMMEIKRASRKAAAAAAAAPPAAASTSISTANLIAEMEAAINR